MNLSDTSPLHRSHFHYALPDELIAQYPLQERTQSRLLVLDQDNDLMDQHFNNLTQWLFPGDLLVFNNTKVLNARLFARKPSGGRVEVLVERLLDEKRVLAHLRLSKPMRKGGAFSWTVGMIAALSLLTEWKAYLFWDSRVICHFRTI